MSVSRKRNATVLLATAVLSGVGTVAVFGGTAEAVPAAQSRCSFDFKTINVSDGWQPLGLGVTINNGHKPRHVIAQLATDMGVVTNAEVRVGYSIDGGAVQEKVFGPGNLANHQEFWETKSTLALIPLSRGTHTVAPYWRISGGAGTSGAFENGCFTVEGRTH
jgi:hypothetical protein